MRVFPLTRVLAQRIPQATNTIADWSVLNADEIRIWGGLIADIPDGWQLCDGTNGTRDLRALFVFGAQADSGATYNVGDTGGATTDTSGAPSATTTVDNNADASTIAVGSSGHTHEVDIMPPYLVLAYIQYTG